MKLLPKIVSGIGLVLTIVPSLFVFNSTLDLDTAKTLMLLGTVVWFASAPVWMNKEATSEGN